MAQEEANVRMVAVGTEAIDVEELRRAVSDPSAGASVVFTGDVRDNDHERSVVSLTYEAHPGAQAALDDVAADVAREHDVIAVALVHRHGPIPIGEASGGRCERSAPTTGVRGVRRSRGENEAANSDLETPGFCRRYR